MIRWLQQIIKEFICSNKICYFYWMMTTQQHNSCCSKSFLVPTELLWTMYVHPCLEDLWTVPRMWKIKLCIIKKQWSADTWYLRHEVQGGSTAILQNCSQMWGFQNDQVLLLCFACLDVLCTLSWQKTMHSYGLHCATDILNGTYKWRQKISYPKNILNAWNKMRTQLC